MNNKGLAFIHIPKTGGKYIQLKCFKNESRFLNLGHRCFVKLNRENVGDEKYEKTCLDFDLKNFKIFTVIRNPFEILTSIYFHDYDGQDGWDNCRTRFNWNTFESFIKCFCDTQYNFYRPMFRNFMFWQIFNSNGECVPDYIIRNEYLDEGLIYLSDLMNLQIDIGGRVGDSSKRRYGKNYKEFYNTKLIKMVEVKCKRELDSFGYTFNGNIDGKVFVDGSNIFYNPINENC